MISKRAGLRDVSCRLRAALTLAYMCMTDSRRKTAQISRLHPAGQGLLSHGPSLQTGGSLALKLWRHPGQDAEADTTLTAYSQHT